MNEFIFINRNKAYGAFQLRRLYHNNVLIGLGITMSAFLLLLFFLIKVSKYDPPLSTEDFKTVEYSVNLVEIQPKKKPDQNVPKPVDPLLEKSKIKDQTAEKEPQITNKIEDVKSTVEVQETKEIKTNNEVLNTQNISESGGSGKVPSVSSDTSGDTEYSDKIYLRADENAYPKGGFELFNKIVEEKLVYPPFAIETKVNGIVFLKAIVNTNGTLSDIEVIKHIEKTVDDAALEVMKHSPVWIPARLKGKIIRQRVIIKIYIKPRS